MHLIQKLAIAIEYITDPARMFGQDLTTADIFLIVDHLMGYINQLEELKSDIKIEGANLELQKIAQEGNGLDLQSDQSKEAIDNFMKLLNKETIK